MFLYRNQTRKCFNICNKMNSSAILATHVLLKFYINNFTSGDLLNKGGLEIF
ncbi:hypothetical protein AAJ76_391000882 [Vairimorpha ceranae]|uniref:Uncharacterized protein n=1 Tax=Vairimorpha ceranae TaxID=40302 RepID=A0A0F9YL94_9MICR|nr:hypothetical protein AAJ76_391000882 [Vairimorpha ceranae]KKO73607.1 hypothetical protein AAJ76_391000882 [Vairimorpha ceranae]